MASSGFLVICHASLPSPQSFAQFVLSFVPQNPSPLLSSSADPETIRLISAFITLTGLEGRVDHKLDSRHTAGTRTALRDADLGQYRLVSEDFEEEGEAQYKERVLATVQRATGVVLVSKEVWGVLSNGEMQESVVVKICGEEAEELADIQAFTRFLSPLPVYMKPVQQEIKRPDPPAPQAKPNSPVEGDEPLIAAIEAVLDAPPEGREALRSMLRKELRTGLSALKTHYEGQLTALRKEMQNTLEIWKAEKAALIASIGRLEQRNTAPKLNRLEAQLSQLQKTTDKLYDSLPALQAKVPALVMQVRITPDCLTLHVINRKPYDINHLHLVIKGQNGIVGVEEEFNISARSGAEIGMPNPESIGYPLSVALVQGDREVAAVALTQGEHIDLEAKFQHVREMLQGSWTPQLESYLSTLRGDERAEKWTEGDLIDLLFNLQPGGR